MSYQSLRIIFMGTPEFAVASLEALVNAGCNIVAVITAPDKPAGRGMELQQSAVKTYAVQQQLNILQPEKLKQAEFIDRLRLLNADLQLVVAFRMLPELLWNMPAMGTINLHGSLLPQYRGAAPINWAVINGERETGVTTFKLQHEIDTGNILMQESFPIGAEETAGEVHDRMKEIGAQLLLSTVKGLSNGTLREKPQHAINTVDGVLHHAPKIFTETCQVNWNKTAREIHNLIRGLSPYPTAFTFLNEKKLKIYKGIVIVDNAGSGNSEVPGTVQTDHKTYLRFAAADGYISVTDLQLEGKKRMNVTDFLRGYRF